MIRLLHTADAHLGRQFPSLRERAGDYRQQLLRTFEKTVDLAVTERVSLFLVAGDLFDSNRVYGLTVGRVLSSFRKLDANGIRVCIIPGTHDAYNDNSLYRSLSLPQNVTVLTPEHNRQTFEDLHLTLYGLLPQSGSSDNPLQGLSLAENCEFHVGMAHCSVKRSGIIEKDAMTLDPGKIAGSGLDYLALGHWHSFQDFSQGTTIACYSGSPEPIDMDQKGAGNVVMVTLVSKGKTEFQPVRVGTKQCESMVIEVGPESCESIAKKIEARADPNLFLEVALTGLKSMDYDLNCQEIENLLRGHFFHLRVDDRSRPELEEVKSRNYSEKTVVGRYVKIMEEKIVTAGTPEEKALYEESLRLGFALLQGRPQVIE